jgi:hypothetical protein
MTENNSEQEARTKKNSFVMYDDWFRFFERMDYNTIGEIVMGIYAYRFYGEITDFSEDPLLDSIFNFIIGAIKRDEGKYMKRCIKMQENAKKRVQEEETE